jgi:hypothetical protein
VVCKETKPGKPMCSVSNGPSRAKYSADSMRRVRQQDFAQGARFWRLIPQTASGAFKSEDSQRLLALSGLAHDPGTAESALKQASRELMSLCILFQPLETQRRDATRDMKRCRCV